MWFCSCSANNVLKLWDSLLPQMNSLHGGQCRNTAVIPFLIYSIWFACYLLLPCCVLETVKTHLELRVKTGLRYQSNNHTNKHTGHRASHLVTAARP